MEDASMNRTITQGLRCQAHLTADRREVAALGVPVVGFGAGRSKQSPEEAEIDEKRGRTSGRSDLGLAVTDRLKLWRGGDTARSPHGLNLFEQ